MKIEVPVGAREIALYALDMVQAEPDPVSVLLNANKREIFALARANIQSFGKDTAINRAGNLVSVEDFLKLEQHVKKQFPEVD